MRTKHAKIIPITTTNVEFFPQIRVTKILKPHCCCCGTPLYCKRCKRNGETVLALVEVTHP